MSSEEEKKFLKLIKLSFDTSLKVTRAFTRTNVLKDDPLKTFLEVNKHKIYHLWCGYAKCCECSLDYKLTNNKSLLKDQFTILYDIGPKLSEGHVVRKNNMVVQHCICCINVNPHCSLDKLDITILSSLLTNCATLSPTNEMWLKSVREIRNNICHALSTTCFDRGRLDKWWTKLEGAVLGLSSKVAIYYEESIIDVVNLLKNSDLTLDNRKEFMDLIKAENEKFYEDFIKNQNNNFEKFAEKQELQCVLLKEDVTKLLQQHKDELSIDLNNLRFEIRQINLPSSTSKSSSTMVLPSDQLATQSSSTATVTLDEQATHSRNMDTETDRSNIEGSDILYVEWRFANPPDSWKVSEMKTALNQMSAMIKQWFKVEFVYIGSLVITTSVPKHVLLEREFLQSAIKSFLENIVKVCNIDTSKHERIQVDFTVMNRIPDVVLPNDSTCIKREDIRDSTKKKDGVQCQRCHDKLKKIHHLKKYNTELQQNFKRYIVSFKKTKDKFEKQTVKKRADSVHELSFKKVNLEADVEVAEAREPSFKKVKLEADLERAEAREPSFKKVKLEADVEVAEARDLEQCTEGNEVDDDAECDCCKSIIEEEKNEMVFCDGCNVCVHQACYGVLNIPAGKWFCKPCLEHVEPNCVLCPIAGGAMKKTSDGTSWAHVRCAWWIPEVKIGNATEMEPIIDIEKIPDERWALICYLCKEKIGACIQCSIKSCKKSFHVTCAHKHKLRMDEDEDESTGLKFKAYCKTHSIQCTPKKKPQKKTKAAKRQGIQNRLKSTEKAVGKADEQQDQELLKQSIQRNLTDIWK